MIRKVHKKVKLVKVIKMRIEKVVKNDQNRFSKRLQISKKLIVIFNRNNKETFWKSKINKKIKKKWILLDHKVFPMAANPLNKNLKVKSKIIERKVRTNKKNQLLILEKKNIKEIENIKVTQ